MVVVIWRIHHEMRDDVFDSMHSLHIEEIHRVMRRRKVTIHAVRYKALKVVHMRRCLPGIVGPLDFVARCAELRSACPHHGVVCHAEDWKTDHNPKYDQEGRFQEFFHRIPPSVSMAVVREYSASLPEICRPCRDSELPCARPCAECEMFVAGCDVMAANWNVFIAKKYH